MFSFSIHSWMISDLKLSGNELLVYGIIYHFSSLEGNYYTGSLNTISKTLNISLNTVQRTLKKLIDNNLIFKEDMIIKKVNYCRYHANLDYIAEETNTEGIAKMAKGYSQNGSQGNIYNNKLDNINTRKQDTSNLVTRGGKLFDLQKGKEKKADKYNRMYKMLLAFLAEHKYSNSSFPLQASLKQYLDFRIKKGLEPEQWVKILEPLQDYTEQEIINKVNNALAGGYMVLVPEWELNKKTQRVDNIVDVVDNYDHKRSKEAF